jgi:hypothetical protein
MPLVKGDIGFAELLSQLRTMPVRSMERGYLPSHAMANQSVTGLFMA